MAALEKILNNHLAVPGYDQIGKRIKTVVSGWVVPKG